MHLYGLIGKTLSHSFSPGYFANKFKKENIKNADYQAFELQSIEDFPALMQEKKCSGLNVTIPYKQSIIPFLDALDPAAAEVGAVNTIAFAQGKTKGYNTDIVGFEQSLAKAINEHNQWKTASALVLGTGGASLAVQYVLKKWGWHYALVSQSGQGNLSYQDIDKQLISQYFLIVNTSPLGMYPHVHECPELPYPHLQPAHLLYDLIYNPAETLFLQKAKEMAAYAKNGLEMLYLQAEASWEIWNNPLK